MRRQPLVELEKSMRVRFEDADPTPLDWQKVLAAIPSNLCVREAMLLLDSRNAVKCTPDITSVSGRQQQDWDRELTTRCEVQLRAHLPEHRVLEKDSAGQILVVPPGRDKPLVVNLSYNIYPLAYAVVLKCREITQMDLTAYGLRALRVSSNDLELCYMQFGEEWGVAKIGEANSKDFGDYARILNGDLAAAGAPRLVKGTARKGFWLDTLPSLVSFLPAPPFDFNS